MANEQQYRLGVIGAGNMGGAIVRGAISANVLTPAEIVIADPTAERRAEFESLGCAVTPDPNDGLAAEQMMLAIKPQVFSDVADSLGSLPRSMPVISIMAGLSSAAIRSALGENARVIRVMPNTPCQIGCGATGLALGDGAKPGDEKLAKEIMNAIGVVVEIEYESLMHAVTAVSGSGPAYVFLLAEAMQQAAMQMGLHNHAARTLVEQTIFGAGNLLRESNETASELRRQVTSPGGTTAAAIEYMFEKELPEIVEQAVIRARDRGIELGGG